MLYGENIFKDVSNYAYCIMYMLTIYFKPSQILNSLTFRKICKAYSLEGR
jgi:hypothetical protein